MGSRPSNWRKRVPRNGLSVQPSSKPQVPPGTEGSDGRSSLSADKRPLSRGKQGDYGIFGDGVAPKGRFRLLAEARHRQWPTFPRQDLVASGGADEGSTGTIPARQQPVKSTWPAGLVFGSAPWKRRIRRKIKVRTRHQAGVSSSRWPLARPPRGSVQPKGTKARRVRRAGVTPRTADHKKRRGNSFFTNAHQNGCSWWQATIYRPGQPGHEEAWVIRWKNRPRPQAPAAGQKEHHSQSGSIVE